MINPFSKKKELMTGLPTPRRGKSSVAGFYCWRSRLWSSCSRCSLLVWLQVVKCGWYLQLPCRHSPCTCRWSSESLTWKFWRSSWACLWRSFQVQDWSLWEQAVWHRFWLCPRAGAHLCYLRNHATSVRSQWTGRHLESWLRLQISPSLFAANHHCSFLCRTVSLIHWLATLSLHSGPEP